MNGELIGMNSAIARLVSAAGSDTIQSGSIGIGFAIPVDNAARIAGELIATGKATHGWLGLQATNDAEWSRSQDHRRDRGQSRRGGWSAYRRTDNQSR